MLGRHLNASVAGADDCFLTSERLVAGGRSRWRPLCEVSRDAVIGAFLWIVGNDDWPTRVFLLIRPQAGRTISAADVLAVATGTSSDLMIEQFATLEELIERPVDQMRLPLMMMGAVAALSLMLAAAGIYTALGHSVGQRLTELGIRRALGSTGSRLVWAAVSRDLLSITAGVVMGCLATLWMTHIAFNELLVVSAIDARVWIVVAAIMITVGSLASFGPAVRATQVDPATLLRTE